MLVPSPFIVILWVFGDINPVYVLTLGVTSVSVVPVKSSTSSVYVVKSKFCFLCVILYGVFVFAVYIGLIEILSSSVNVISFDVLSFDHFVNVYPGISFAFKVICVSYGYVPSNVSVSTLSLSSKVNVYVLLLYTYTTSLVPSAFIVILWVSGDINPVYVLTLGVTIVSVVPVLFSTSSVYVVKSKFCFLCITLYAISFLATHCAYNTILPFDFKFFTFASSKYTVPVPSLFVFHPANIYPDFTNVFLFNEVSWSYVIS